MRTTLSRFPGNVSLILICAALGACATTQKSTSSESGGQTAAPISEASQPSDKGSASNGTSSASSTTAGAGASTGAKKPGGTSSDSGSTASDNAEAAQLKRNLDEQDAQINRLRNEQQADAARIDAESARAEAEAARAQAAQTEAARSGAAGAGKSAVDDEAAVFPSDGSPKPAAGAGAAGATGADATDSNRVVPATSERSIYFSYNEIIVAEKYDDMLLANAAYLRAHPNFTAEVQGNCDERGSREYNLALGARRAEAVKRALVIAGADGSRISTISYGAEKPVASGKDEQSYSKNRRVDILY